MVREQYLVLLLVGLIILFVFVNALKKRKILFNIVLAACLGAVFFFGENIISLNVLSKEYADKIQEVVDTVGDTYITIDRSNIYVNINDEWVNLQDVAIVKDLTKDIVIEYDGQEITIGHSGVYNTLKVLQNAGLLRSKE